MSCASANRRHIIHPEHDVDEHQRLTRVMKDLDVARLVIRARVLEAQRLIPGRHRNGVATPANVTSGADDSRPSHAPAASAFPLMPMIATPGFDFAISPANPMWSIGA
jgi:hypothetical protein